MAAPILAYEDLGLVQGAGWLFRDLDLYIGARDRLALIGRNGAGKTTLLKLLAGRSRPTRAGARSCRAHASCCSSRIRASTASRRCAISCCAGDDAPRAARGRGDRRPARHRPVARGRDRVRAASGAARRSPARWRRSPTCCCSTSRPTISTSPRSNGSRTGSKRFNGAFVVISHDRTFLTRLTSRRCGSTAARSAAPRSALAASRRGPSRSMPRKRATPRSSTRSSSSRSTGCSAASPGGGGATRAGWPSCTRCAPQRAAMLGPQGTAKLATRQATTSRPRSVIDAEQRHQELRRPHDHPRLHAARPARRPDRHRRRRTARARRRCSSC